MAPLVTAVTTFFVNMGLQAVTAEFLAGFIVRVTMAIGLSALARALTPKPEVKKTGIKSDVTQTGGTDPQAFVVGFYATGGQLVAPPMTHGEADGQPNAYLTYVVAVSDVPGVSLFGLLVDGAWAPIGTSSHPDYGHPLTIKGKAGGAWIKFYDGSQTTADPMLRAKYGADPRRPWRADMVGRGTAYAILTFRIDRERFKGFPAVRFVLNGIPLYDPRRDTTIGGSGSQIWSDPSTWTHSGNPAVIAYNILRGIAIPGGDIWGGGWSETDLPLASWIAAMNAADAPVSLSAGGTEPAYRAGYEVTVDQEPGEILAELLKVCAGRMADVGGAMKIAAGAPGLPIKSITDDDIVVTEEQSQSLFPSLAETHNGVHATFPDPYSQWESRDAPPRYDGPAEAADGRRLIATVSLPACPYAAQVQRLMLAWINEERRFRRHQLVLGPDAVILEPLDVIAWTSARNGYVGKLFEVAEIAHDPVSLLQLVSLREVDPADYAWTPTDELPWTPPDGDIDPLPVQIVPLFDAEGLALDDGAGAARRPALLLTWDGANQDDVSALIYELRVQAGTQVVSGATLDVAAGRLVVTAGVLADTSYEVRARFVAPRPVGWTVWKPAITPSVALTIADFGGALDALFADAGIAPPHIVSTLPAGNPAGWDMVWLTTDASIRRWDAAAGEWTARVNAADIDGLIDGASQIATGTITTGLLAAAAVKVRDMEIDDLLSIDATAAGFSMGKLSGADFEADGIYMGRDQKLDGTLGYAFLMGTTIAGNHSYIQATADAGLNIVNADFSLFAQGVGSSGTIGASQTITLPVGSKTITLDLIGGGGGGGVYTTGQTAAATAGGATKVELWDGTTNTGIFWTAAGGAAGASTLNQAPTAGQSSAYGSGGAAGSGGYTTTDRMGLTHTYPPVNGGAAGGRAAGGGGGGAPGGKGGKGGGRGASLTVSLYDISSLANPKLVITIGAGGTRGTNSGAQNSHGGAGTAGFIRYQAYAAAHLPAGVVARTPSNSSTFARAASATGAAIFPNHGPGLWVVSCAASNLEMNIRASVGGQPINCWASPVVTFVSDMRPEVVASSTTARTYTYNFHPMKV